MPEGFDLVVDYGANSQVCKLQVPALMPTTESVDNATVMRQRMYHFLSELVPFLGERPADFVVHPPARQRVL